MLEEDPDDPCDINEAIDRHEAETSPEHRRRKAEHLRTVAVERWRWELPILRWWRTKAERDYRIRADRDAFTALQEAIGEEVSCELAIAHIDAVAAEIEAGDISYEEREQREFAEAVRSRIAASMKAAADARPKQLLWWWGDGARSKRRRQRLSRRPCRSARSTT